MSKKIVVPGKPGRPKKEMSQQTLDTMHSIIAEDLTRCVKKIHENFPEIVAPEFLYALMTQVFICGYTMNPNREAVDNLIDAAKKVATETLEKTK